MTESRGEKAWEHTATFSRKRENFPYTSILTHVAEFELRDTKKSVAMAYTPHAEPTRTSPRKT